MTFLDTNVLVYAVDGRDAEKQQAAKKIVMAARNSPEYMISVDPLPKEAATLYGVNMIVRLMSNYSRWRAHPS